MARRKNAVGLDIGSSSIKVVQLKESAKGVELLNFDIALLPPEAVVDGALMNFTAIVDKVRELWSVNRIRNKDVALSVSGHSVIIKKISLPEMTPEELEESIQWEAEQYIPFDIKDVNVDVQILNPNAGQGQMDVLLVAAKKDVINDYTSVTMEAGLRPVIEIMYPDFSLVAADQLFNQIGKLRHMFNGQISFPLVVRTRFAVGAGYGGHHSMDPVGIFGLFAGWRIVAASNPFDYVGLFNTALRFNDPVLVIDEHRLYPEKGLMPAGAMDYYIQYGKAKVVREGSDLTVLSYLKGVQDCLVAAENASNEGISVEIIDLRTLDYIGMDYETIGRSVKKTNSVLIVEHSASSMGLAGRLSHEIQERFFDHLDCPIHKLTLPDVPPPVSKPVEQAIIPGPEEIKAKMIQGGRHHF